MHETTYIFISLVLPKADNSLFLSNMNQGNNQAKIVSQGESTATKHN